MIGTGTVPGFADKNPFRERRDQISKWRKYSTEDIVENKELLDLAGILRGHGIKKIDALHIASAIHAGADYFLTTDDGILKKAILIRDLHVTDPIGFIKEVLT
ncbi:MAG: PIN domain-containing protein [Desulfohalobiaceae bacterium]|nr:PIN domain-containing protein [Desulfohalobiaceae bacterium]